MKVFRLMEEQELKLFLENKTQKLGRTCVRRPMSNSFSYKKNVRYIHFFKSKGSLKYIEKLRCFAPMNADKKYYECTFEVSPTALFLTAGVGYYFEGTLPNRKRVRVREYAVPAKRVSAKNLKEYKLFTPHTDERQL